MKTLFVAGISLLLTITCTGAAPAPATAPAATVDLSSLKVKDDVWVGFQRHKFVVDGCDCWLAEPKLPLPGNHWAWCMMFPTPYPDRTGAIALLSKGYFYAYMSVGDTFGAPSALAHLDAFFKAMTGVGLRSKAVLIGISRGGLYAYNWAAKNPDSVSVIYGDAPVCNFKSWPYAHGAASAATEWKKLMTIYGFQSDEEAFASRAQPINELTTIAAAKIPLISVVGDADKTVPYKENTAIVEKEYHDLGGEMTVIHKPGGGHHPHGLDDPTPVVNFITEHDH